MRTRLLLLAFVTALLLAPGTSHATCTCTSLQFSYDGGGAYQTPDARPISLKQGCNIVLGISDEKFSAASAGTCNSLGFFGGTCLVTRTITTPCFGSGNIMFFVTTHYDYHCLSCGL